MNGGQHKKRDGFTLIEILLGMGVAIMVIVGVVAVSVATTRLTATIADAEAEALRIDMLEQILRDNLEQLPQQASYMSIEPETGDAGRVLAIENAFGAFSLGNYGMSADRYLFRPVADGDGGVILRLEYYRKDEEELSWFEEPYLPDPTTALASINLIGGLQAVSWWQLMAAEEEWIPIELVDERTQPAALRLDMMMLDGEAMSWTFRNPMWKLDQTGGLRGGGRDGNRGGGRGRGGDNQNGGQGGDGRPGQGAGRGDGQPRAGADQGGRGGSPVRPQIPNGASGRGGGR